MGRGLILVHSIVSHGRVVFDHPLLLTRVRQNETGVFAVLGVRLRLQRVLLLLFELASIMILTVDALLDLAEVLVIKAIISVVTNAFYR